MQRDSTDRIKNDERILADGDFVEAVLQPVHDRRENRYALIAAGMDLQAGADRVGQVFNSDSDMVWKKGSAPIL